MIKSWNLNISGRRHLNHPKEYNYKKELKEKKENKTKKNKAMVESCPNIIGNLNSSKFVNCLFLKSVQSKCVLD